MKISIAHLALVGLSYALPTIVGRAPQGPTPSGKQLTDVVTGGIEDWGPAGTLKPPASPKPPLRFMPGSPRPYHKTKDPNIKTGVTRIPGQPLGPAKKCRPCKKKRELCCGGSLGVSIKSPSKQPTKGVPKGGAKFISRFRVPSSVGKAGAFMVVAPYAHDVLDTVKSWDNPIGYAVTWFDNAMASLQEAIGGPQRNDIYGNELKYKVIKGMGKALQMGFETDYERYQRERKEAAERERLRQEEERKEREVIRGLEQLAEICEKMETEPPEHAKLAADVGKSCEALAAMVKTIQD